MSQIWEVAVPCPLRRSFDYILNADQHVVRGQRVLVPFSGRKLVGIALKSKSNSDTPEAKLKAIEQVLDDAPILSKEILELGLWSANYYHHPIGDCLIQTLPVKLRSAKPIAPLRAQAWRLTQKGSEVTADEVKRAPKQWQMLELARNGPITAGDSSVIKALLNKDWLKRVEAQTPSFSLAQTPPKLHKEQTLAVDAINASADGFQPWLLDGVTGSGKTEVYLQLIAAARQRGKQALVLIPEIGLTPQTLARFQSRFDEPVAALHSGLSDGERLRVWQKAEKGLINIVLGTRSAIFTPLKNLGIILVDEEHDTSYKQGEGWRYHARDLAVKRAAYNKCPVVMGTATPALETLHNSMEGRYKILKLRYRAGGAKAPTYAQIDIRGSKLEDGLSPELLTAIGEHLDAGNQALLFLNRRGFAPTLQCHSCGWVASCTHCDARLTTHIGHQQLRCHHCESREPIPRNCPQCANTALEFKGPGTERLAMALAAHFGDRVPIIRVDRDTTQNRDSWSQATEQVRTGEPCILVGTQMLAKGHHFPDVTLVGIIDIDSSLFSSDFRGPERSGQILVQVAGRAGRAKKQGTVWIQTHCPQHPVLQTLIDQGYADFAKGLLAERRALWLPPFTYCAVIRADAKKLESAESWLRKLRPESGTEEQVQFTGPLPAPMARKAGRFRAALILKASSRRQLHQQLNALCAQAEKLRGKDDLRWSVDVDPQDLY